MATDNSALRSLNRLHARRAIGRASYTDYMDIAQLLQMEGGQELWDAIDRGDATADDFNKVFFGMERMRLGEQYRNEDWFQSFDQLFQTYTTGTTQDRNTSNATMFSDLRQMAIASQYVDDLVDETNTSGFLPEEGWQAIESIYGVTKDQFESEGFGSEELKRIRTEYNANKEAGMTEGIISILTSLSGEDRGVVLNAFKRDGAGLEGLGLGGRADLRSLIGITGFKVDNEGKASIDLSSSYGTYSLKDAAAKAVERTKRTVDSTMIESILGLRPGAKLTQQQQEWINANSEFAAMYNARQEGDISEERFKKYATQKQTGSPLDYDYYSTMLGSDTDTITETLKKINALGDEDPIRAMYLSMLDGLGEPGKNLADAIRNNKEIPFLNSAGSLTETNAQTLENLVNGLSDMQMKEELLNDPMLQDYLDIIGGLRSPSAAAQGRAYSTAMDTYRKAQNANYYLGELDTEGDNAHLTQPAADAFAAMLNMEAKDVIAMAKTQSGRDALKGMVKGSVDSVEKMMELIIENSGEKAAKALESLKGQGDVDTEGVVAGLLEADVEQSVIDLVRRIGYSIANGVSSVDIPDTSIANPLQDTVVSGVEAWKKNDNMTQAGKLLSIISDPGAYMQNNGLNIGINPNRPFSTYMPQTIKTLLASIQDEDLNNWLEGNTEAIGYTWAAENGIITPEQYADWLRYATVGYNGVETYGTMQEKLFNGPLTHSGTNDYYLQQATSL